MKNLLNLSKAILLLSILFFCGEEAFAGRDVRLFFTKRDKRGKWNGLITTNRKLDEGGDDEGGGERLRVGEQSSGMVTPVTPE